MFCGRCTGIYPRENFSKYKRTTEGVLKKILCWVRRDFFRAKYLHSILLTLRNLIICLFVSRYFVNMDENSQFSIFDFSQELIRESYSPVFFYVISGDERLVFTFQPGKTHDNSPGDTLMLQ